MQPNSSLTSYSTSTPNPNPNPNPNSTSNPNSTPNSTRNPNLHSTPNSTALEVPPQIAEVRRRKAQAMSKEALAVEDEMKENQTLYDQAAPLRHHLLKTVMPAVTESIVLVCEDQPDDPVDFIRKA